MAKTYRIKAQANVPGGRFCRGGRCFGTAFTTVREDELTAEQLAAIRAEPMLVVEEADEVEPTPPQTEVEADAKAKADAEGEAKGKPADQTVAKAAKKEGGK